MEAPDGWSIQENHLMKEFRFSNFAEAKDFVDKISDVCEARNHHADLHFGWGYVIVEITTHDAGQLTKKDYNLAFEISNLNDVQSE